MVVSVIPYPVVVGALGVKIILLETSVRMFVGLSTLMILLRFV